MVTVFLLSPAYCAGRRAKILLKPGSTLAIAQRLQAGTLTLGEAFTFCSGLYFRGKIAYARTFAPEATLVITPTRGLQSPDLLVTADVLREFAGVDIAADDARYRKPLERDLQALAAWLPAGGRVVLLGRDAAEQNDAPARRKPCGQRLQVALQWLSITRIVRRDVDAGEFAQHIGGDEQVRRLEPSCGRDDESCLGRERPRVGDLSPKIQTAAERERFSQRERASLQPLGDRERRAWLQQDLRAPSGAVGGRQEEHRHHLILFSNRPAPGSRCSD